MTTQQNFDNIGKEVKETIKEIDDKLEKYFRSFSKNYAKYIAWLIQANGPIVVCNEDIENLCYMTFHKDMFGDVYIVFSNENKSNDEVYEGLGSLNNESIRYNNLQTAKSMLEHMHILLDDNYIEELIDNEYNKFLKIKEEIQKISKRA